MEAYEDLCDKIRSRKSATNSLDYLKTELVLMEYKDEIKQRYEKEKGTFGAVSEKRRSKNIRKFQ